VIISFIFPIKVRHFFHLKKLNVIKVKYYFSVGYHPKSVTLEIWIKMMFVSCRRNSSSLRMMMSDTSLLK